MPSRLAALYFALWATACLGALVIALRARKRIAIANPRYWRGLARGWKLGTFALAFVGIVGVAPRSGDPTWDYWDAAFMAILTYLTAPWTLGIVVRSLRRSLGDRRPAAAEIYVAACAWFFSASFSYDLYLWLRDGNYPSTWSSNAVASSGLYAAGGAMWSLRWTQAGGTTFAFLVPDWPESLADGGVRGILPFVVGFMLLVVGLLSPFLWMALHGG